MEQATTWSGGTVLRSQTLKQILCRGKRYLSVWKRFMQIANQNGKSHLKFTIYTKNDIHKFIIKNFNLDFYKFFQQLIFPIKNNHRTKDKPIFQTYQQNPHYIF